MKYTNVQWSPEIRDWVPVAPRPSRFWSLAENAVGFVLLVVGVVLFIGLMHYLPDSAELAAQMRGAE